MGDGWWNSELVRKPRLPPQNLPCKLFLRAIGGRRPRRTYRCQRTFYQNVFPDRTVQAVEKPVCTLRRFTPDGRHLIAISGDQQSVQVFRYRGAAGAGAPLPDPDSAPRTLFSRLFTLRHNVRVAPLSENLNRECSLFTDDGRHVIVASVSVVTDAEQRQTAGAASRTNEWVQPGPRTPLENYSLHVVHVEDGRRCDTVPFPRDKIFTSHNQGLYLYGQTLAVLSVQHQTVHVFLVTSQGRLQPLRVIGRFCREDDQMLFDSTAPPAHRMLPASDGFLCALKHRLLVFLYREARAAADPAELLRFYQHFERFCSLRMWKMQLLDAHHLLIRYATEEVVTFRVEHGQQPSVFVVYNMCSSSVLAVYSNLSQDLLYLYENFCDHFRNARLSVETRHTCSPSNSVHSRHVQALFKHTIQSARNGSRLEATRRLLVQLPISGQSYSCTPYLDLQLFSYDEKWVSAMERPKPCGEQPIRFYARDSGLLRFGIQAGLSSRSPPLPPTARRLVAFIFHPTDPFAISVQRTNAEYVVNFHLRHDTDS